MAEVTSGKDLTVIVLDAQEVTSLRAVLNLREVTRIIDGHGGQDGYAGASAIKEAIG